MRRRASGSNQSNYGGGVDRGDHVDGGDTGAEERARDMNDVDVATIDATCTRMPSGDLVICLTPTANRARIRWMRERFGSAYALATALDYECERGWAWVQPEDGGLGHCTHAPMVTDDGRYDATARRIKIWGSLWWYPDYYASDPVETLLARGAVTFRPLLLRREARESR